MEEGNTKDLENENSKPYEFFSKVVRAGRRTYFFDVKATLNNDYYITIKESKKVINQDGQAYFERHKIFLYPEDFEKFSEYGALAGLKFQEELEQKFYFGNKDNLLKASQCFHLT